MNIEEFNYNVNLLQAILWQYDESTNLLSLINKKQNWYNTYQTQFWIDWYNNVFNILTANQFGLSVWSYILNLPLYLDNPVEDPSKPIWGFNNNSLYPILENTYLNFQNGNFSIKNQIINLSIEEQRFLLRLRYFQLVSNGIVSIPQTIPGSPLGINQFLNYLCLTSSINFTGTIYALDGLDMTMTYVITTADFPQNLFDVIIALDLFPRPTGVLLKVHINYGFQWGFNSGSFGNYINTNKNFSHGNFIDPFISPILEEPPPFPHHEIMISESDEIMLSETGKVMITE